MYNSFSHSFRAGRRIGNITDPTKLANLQVWYNADIASATNFNVAPSDGSDISQWSDRSGTGHSANKAGNAAAKPNWYANQQNGYGVIRFNGTSESLDINPFAFTQNLPGFSLYLVAKSTSLTGSRVLTTTDQGGFRFAHDGSVWSIATSGGTGASTVAGDTTGFHMFGLIFNGTGAGNADRLKFRYDRVERALTFSGTVGTLTSATANILYIGQDSNNTGYFQGDVGEMLMFTRALNGSEIINVEGYLASHWNLDFGA